MDVRRDERSLGQLLGDLSRQLSTLVRHEIDLAKAEVATKAGAASRSLVLIGAGGALAYTGLLIVLAAVVLGLVQAGLDPWLAALVVGLVAAVVGGVLIWRGRDGLMTTDFAPTRTIQTLKDDAEWAKEQIK